MEEKKIFEVKNEFAVNQWNSDILANLINATIAVIIFWPVVEHYILIAWISSLFIGGIIRAAISLPTTRKLLRLSNPSRWYAVYNPLTACFGIIWGLSGYLFFVDGNVGYQMFIAILLTGMVAGSVSSLPVFLPVFYFFMLSLLLPIAILLISQQERLAFGMGVLCVVFIIYTSIAGWRSHNMIVDSISSRFKTEALARLDPLTEIMNRRALDDMLFSEINRAKRDKKAISFAICDIDFFKGINDNLGHLAGDAILRKIAKTISENLARPADHVARYGGEEFALIMPDTAAIGAGFVCERIRNAVELLQLEHPSSSCSKYITISIGVYSHHFGTDDNEIIIEEIIEKADSSLYKAKESGRNKTIAFSSIS